MLKAKLTQKEVAEKAGVHTNYYARVERDEENPSLEILKKLTKILKVKSFATPPCENLVCSSRIIAVFAQDF